MHVQNLAYPLKLRLKHLFSTFSNTSKISSEYLQNKTWHIQPGNGLETKMGRLRCLKVSWTLVHKRRKMWPGINGALVHYQKHPSSVNIASCFIATLCTRRSANERNQTWSNGSGQFGSSPPKKRDQKRLLWLVFRRLRDLMANGFVTEHAIE